MNSFCPIWRKEKAEKGELFVALEIVGSKGKWGVWSRYQYVWHKVGLTKDKAIEAANQKNKDYLEHIAKEH